ncbi:MAG TPA: hypothetical protein GX497_17180 [Bacillus bacterium]|nr:hypothetical protein [Bacillus sp. (in: firmicutes)]
MWNAGLKWMFLIMGTMIGAGYASGREIWQFFGDESGLAILLFTVLFSISCYFIMKISFEKKTIHYRPVLEDLLGKKLAGLYDLMIILYLFSVTVVMLAGSGAALEVFHLPYWAGITVTIVLLVLLFLWDIQGMVSMNAIITPLLVVGLLAALSLFIVQYGQPFIISWSEQDNWPSAFTFTALNILPVVAVLAAIGKKIKHEGEIWIASIGSSLILGGITYIYNEVLTQIASDVIVYEIPLFAILKNYPYLMLLCMSFILWGAIYTTAASGVFGLVTRVRQKTSLPLWVLALIILVVMVPLTTFGFSTLIAVLYPLYGLLNLYMLAAILVYPIANRYKW